MSLKNTLSKNFYNDRKRCFYVEKSLKIALFKFSIEGANMALTNQQVQQVFLAIAGRPAEGSAVAWGANSLSIAALANSVVDIRKGADFANSKETFVENLYSQLLGRASDAEGKEFWLKALNDGASYGDVLAQFINAVLAQPSSADLYTLQNKVSIAEQISAKVATFQGGKDAEAQLKTLMDGVTSSTTFEDEAENVNTFVGQYTTVASKTVKQSDEEAASGSETSATTFNATYTIGADGEIKIEGSTDYHDNLNLKVKGTADNQELTSIGDIKNVSGNINIDMNDSNAAKATLTTSTLGGASKLNITGNSVDKITVDNGISSVNTGAGNDTITLNSDKKITTTVDGGAGTDAVIVSGDNSGVTLKNVEILAGTGKVSKEALTSVKQLGSDDAETYGANASTANITVNKLEKGGINLSNLKAGENITATISLEDVKGGTITLSKTEDNEIEETVKLDAKAASVKINNIHTGDKVDFNNVVGTGALTQGQVAKAVTLAASGTALTTETARVNFIDAGKDVSSVKAAYDFIMNGATTGGVAANEVAVVAFNNGKESAYIYAIKNSGTGTNLEEKMLTLLGKVDNNIDGNDKVLTGEAGILTFA